MTDIRPLVPRQRVPQLTVPLVGGGRFNIASETSDVIAKNYPARGEVVALSAVAA